jgi:hypothetical protein
MNRLNYHARLVRVRERRFYRLIGTPGWAVELAALERARDAYLMALREVQG